MATGTRKQATKEMPCRTCGELMTVNIRKRLLPQHIECSMANVGDAIRQMHAKSGPLYEKWYASRWPAERRRPPGTPRGQAKV